MGTSHKFLLQWLHLLNFSTLVFFLVETLAAKQNVPNIFENERFLWGKEHMKFSPDGKEIEFSLHQSSLGAGIVSQLDYYSGSFTMGIKPPGKESAGVVTVFQVLTSPGHASSNKLEFSFLRDNNVEPCLLRTNVYQVGVGDRHETFSLWFDPSKSFHNYTILWNEHQIVFLVDKAPIRVFNNNTHKGIPYLAEPVRYVISIWNGNTSFHWTKAKHGHGKINWEHGPYKAHFRSIGIDGCIYDGSNSRSCTSSKYWWNKKQYWKLTAEQQKSHDYIRDRNLVYDYCTERRNNLIAFPECSSLFNSE